MNPVMRVTVALLVIQLSFASGSTARGQADPQTVRADIYEVLAITMRLAQQAGNAERAGMLVEYAYDRMAEVTDDELLAISDTAGLLVRFKDAAARFETQLTSPRKPLARTATLPAPDWPSECPETAMEGELDALLAALIVKQVATTAFAIASVCEQSVPIPLIGGCVNASAVCIPFAVAVQVATGVWEGLQWCAVIRNGVRLSASYDRSGHLHDDLSTTHVANMKSDFDAFDSENGNITSALAAHYANRTTRYNTHDADLLALQADLTTRANTIDQENVNITSALATHYANRTTRYNTHDTDLWNLQLNLTARSNQIDTEIADLLGVLSTQHQLENALMLRLNVEKALANREEPGLGLLRFPASVGGHIDLVASVTADTISRFQDAGLKTFRAEEYLADANALVAAGDLHSAFDKFRFAYQNATRGTR